MIKLPSFAVFLGVVAFSAFLLTIDENNGLRLLSETPRTGNQNQNNNNNNNNNNNKKHKQLSYIEEVGPMPKMISSPESTGVCKKNAIVYMAQKHHSSYDRDSYGLLKQSLDLLYENYLNDNHNESTSLFIFHTGEFDAKDLRELEARVPTKGLMNFVDLSNTSYWHIPPWLRNDDPQKWSQPDVYSVGYRHMIRWYAKRMWDYFARLNAENGCDYKYVMRMDEESFIYSKIDYNMFTEMETQGYQYGYRSCSYEMKHVDKMWQNYVQQPGKHAIQPKRPFVGRNLCGFYNNWFMADLSFFWSPPVQEFLKFADHSGNMYRHRSNDLILQTAAVYAFADQSKVHRFLDFTYQHFTSYHDSGCPMWGSLATGYNDAQGTAVADNLVKELRAKGCPREGEDFKFKLFDLPQTDLSPTYNHLPAHMANITLRHVKAGLVDVPHKGAQSG